MPELPEVETIVRDLHQTLRGRQFSRIIVHDDFILRAPADLRQKDGQKGKDLIRRLKDRSIKDITRRGKVIIVHLDPGGFLIVQLMMTGQLVFNGQKDRHTRLTFNFTDGTKLLYNDQRRFGQVQVVEKLDQVRHFNLLGPEPLSAGFVPAVVKKAFSKTKRPVKNILLDHTVVAGIGNIYACEILFRSRIDPRRPGQRITAAEAGSIHHEIIEVLQEAIAHRGSSMRNYRDGSGQKGLFNQRLAVYAREGQPCHRCRQPIKRIVQAGRSSFYCGHCQKK